jgi:hypothetical protein
MVTLGQQGGPLGKWGLRLKSDSHLRYGQTFTQGKVAETLDRFKF